jgi:hypothetical protein
MQWVPVNWDASGLGYLAPITQLSQIYEVAGKELKWYMDIKQKISFLFIE